MKRLIICNTYSQLLLAVQLRLTLFKEDGLDLWLSDHPARANEVFERVKKLSLFSDVQFLETREEYCVQKIPPTLKSVLRSNFGPVKDLKIQKYDEIIFYNLYTRLYDMADYYRKIGHRAQWSMFEEGILSYETDFEATRRVTLTRNIRKLTGRPDVAKLVGRYYCVFPELKVSHREWEFVPVPRLTPEQEELKAVLNGIFDYTPAEIRQKYIFFASADDIDGLPYGETEMVLELAGEMGPENLLVKMHPRDTRRVYEEKGISVLRESFVPWEVLQLNGLPEGAVLATVNSGAFLSISAMDSQNERGVFLYPRVKNGGPAFRQRAEEIGSALERLHSLGLCENIRASADIE